MKIWQRYLIRETIGTLFLLLFGFYFLYALMDYSLHAKAFLKHPAIGFPQISVYYLCVMIKRFEFLFPLAMLFATIRLYTSMNRHHELLAFHVGGISLYKLIIPPLFIATCLSGSLYIIYEWVFPHSVSYVEYIQNTVFKKDVALSDRLRVTKFDDGTKLIYTTFSPEEGCKEVYYIISIDELYHSKQLQLVDGKWTGFFVDHFVRNPEGHLVQNESFRSFDFSPFFADPRGVRPIPHENRSISELAREGGSGAGSALAKKVTSPLLPILAVLGIVPYCIRFKRNQTSFILYSASFAAFMSFFVGTIACSILGQYEIFPAGYLFTLLYGITTASIVTRLYKLS